MIDRVYCRYLNNAHLRKSVCLEHRLDQCLQPIATRTGHLQLLGIHKAIVFYPHVSYK